jgi:hypothetical protein
LNHKPKEISFSKIKKKVSDLLHKLQFTIEKVLKTIVKSFDKIVNKIVNDCTTFNNCLIVNISLTSITRNWISKKTKINV